MFACTSYYKLCKCTIKLTANVDQHPSFVTYSSDCLEYNSNMYIDKLVNSRVNATLVIIIITIRAVISTLTCMKYGQ